MENCGLMGVDEIYHLVSSNMAGWKIPMKWRFIARKIIDKWSIFQKAMFDYQRAMMCC